MPYLGKQPVNVIKNNAVSTDTIVDDAVTNAKVAPNAIDTTELANNAVETAKINANAVTDAKLNDNAVTTDKIVDLNVTQGKLAAEAVSEAKLHAGNAPTDNYVLTAAAGQPGGLIWSQLSNLPGSGAWESVAGGNFSSVTSITQSFEREYVYKVLLFNLKTDSTTTTIIPAIQFSYGAGAGTPVNLKYSRIYLGANSTTWTNNSFGAHPATLYNRATLSGQGLVYPPGHNNNATAINYDIYIHQPIAANPNANTGWTSIRYWSRGWGYTASQGDYFTTNWSEGGEYSTTGSWNAITSFKIIDNNLTSNTFSGTYRVLRIGAT